MKQWISLILCLVILLSFSGCETESNVLFFYPRAEIQYGVADGVVAAEARDLADKKEDLEYLLKLYLEGPVSQELKSPFPFGTGLESVVMEDKHITLVLSETFSTLENLEYTIACACVASTCFSLTDAESVSISSGMTALILTRDNYSLWDRSSEQSLD
jgi:hypothetical protein